MTTAEITPIQSVSREQLRTFYLTATGLDALRPGGPLRPSALDSIELPRLERHYPLYLAGSEAPKPFSDLLKSIVEAAPTRFPTLRDSLDLVAGAFGERAAACASLESVLEPALAEASTRLEMMHADAAQLKKEVDALRAALPKSGWLIGFGEQAPVILSCALFSAARHDARANFQQELHTCAQRLEELLTADKRNAADGDSPRRISSSLGQAAATYLQSSALAGVLQRRANPVHPLDPARRVRCQKALAVIYTALARAESLPTVLLVHSGPALPSLVDFGVRQHPTPAVSSASDYTLDLCQDEIDQFVAVWKALRIARLEADSAYDPAIHDEALHVFDWHMAHPEELAALPAVIVSDTAARVEASLGSFTHLLRSGLPIHAVISCPSGLTAKVPDLPLACLENLSLHTSIAAPAHLGAGLAEMAGSFRPTAAVVTGGASWHAAVLMTLSRACPLYRYNPAGGSTWPQRFVLETEPALRFPALTPVHAAALDPACANHFRLLPAGTTRVGQAELVEYPAKRPSQAFHFLPAASTSGDLAHAMFTRELADICTRAESRWTLLAELAAPKVVKEANPEAETRARTQGATQAIERALALLAAPESLN